MAQAWQHVAFDSLACCVSDAEHPLLDMMGTRQEVCLTIETLRAVNDSLMALEAYAKQDERDVLNDLFALRIQGDAERFSELDAMFCSLVLDHKRKLRDALV